MTGSFGLAGNVNQTLSENNVSAGHVTKTGFFLPLWIVCRPSLNNGVSFSTHRFQPAKPNDGKPPCSNGKDCAAKQKGI